MNAIAKRRLQLHTLVLLTLLLLTAASALFFPARAKADSAPQIDNLRIQWLTEDSVSDGIASRLYQRVNNPGSSISMQYQIDVSFTGESSYAPGSIRILIPRQVFHKRNLDFMNGTVLEEGYGRLTFPVPDAPNANSLWHWEEAEDNQYVIINDVRISASAGVMFQLTITGLNAQDLVDMRPSDPITATVEVTGPDGLIETRVSEALTAVVDTQSALTAANADGMLFTSPENVPDSVLERLPGGTQAAPAYVFVRWHTWPNYNGTQYFSLSTDVWEGRLEGNGANIDGILLGTEYASGSIASVTDGETPGNHFTKSVIRYHYDNNGQSHGQYVWTAYPVAGLQADTDYTIRTVAAWEMTESDPERDGDPREVTRKETEAVVSYTHNTWVYPRGEFGVYKFSGSVPSHTHNTIHSERPQTSAGLSGHTKNYYCEMALSLLRDGQPVTMDQFEVLSVGYGYPYTAGPVEEAGVSEEWSKDPSNYLNWAYRMETTDDTVSIKNATGSNITLGEDDYRFTSVTIAAPEMFAYGRQSEPKYRIEGSEFGYNPDSSIEKPIVEVWGKKAGSGSWELLDTVQFKKTSTTRTVTFPEGVTGYRTVITTCAAACKLAAWPQITLLPSAGMQAIAEAFFDQSSSPSATLTNKTRMTATLYQSPVRADETLPEQLAWLESSGDTQVIDASDYTNATLTGAGYDVLGTSDISCTNDVSNRQVRLHFTTKVDETSNLKDINLYNLAVESGVIKKETSATWYILLPPNVELVTGSISMTRMDDRITGIEVRPDFRGTGLTMLVVRASLTPVPHKAHSNATFRDSPSLEFDGILNWTDLNLQSTTEVNAYVAFESGNPGTLGTYASFQGKPDEWSHAVSTPAKIRSAMTDLDPNSNDRRFVYSIGWEQIRIDQMEQTEFVKSVRADADGIWSKGAGSGQEVTVREGQDYTYRLRIAAKRDSRAAEILLFDSIENAVPSETDEPNLDDMKNWSGAWEGKGQWRGTLTWVDMSALYNANCNPVLYYSTVPGLTFGNLSDSPDDSFFSDREGHYDLTDTSVWTRATGVNGGEWYVPDGINVTAIAIDARKTRWSLDFSLKSGEVASVYLHMKAPDDHGESDVWNAKGAYFHTVNDAASPDDIDWMKALDAKNNMHAFNSAILVYTPQNASGSTSQSRTVLRYGNTRIGLVPSMVGVTKTWNDNNNHDNKRPESVTVSLLYKSMASTSAPEYWRDRNSDPVTLTLSEENNWSGFFMDLPSADSNGVPYIFSLEESPVDGYAPGIYTEDGRMFEIVNTHADEQVSVSGEKFWLTADGLTAETTSSRIRLQLRREGSDRIARTVREVDVRPDASGRWLYTFPDQDRYEPGGFEYKYSITESAPYGWVSQDKPLPAGMELGFTYDPVDLTTFRNIWVPPFGSVLLIKHAAPGTVADNADTGNVQFTFSFQLTTDYYDNTPVTGEFEYTVFDRAPEGRGTVIPAGAAAIRSGKISHNGTITLGLEQCALIKGLPENSYFRFVESPSTGWTGRTVSYNDGYVGRGDIQSVAFRNSYSAKGSFRLRGTKQLAGRLPEAGEFSFELVDRTSGSQTEGRVVAKNVNTACSETAVAEDGTVTGTAAVLFSEVPVSLDVYGGSRSLVYEVRETAPNRAETLPDGTVCYHGVTYDTTPRMITVTVTDNGDGTVSAEFGGEDYPLVFRNEYHAEAEAVVSVRKKMSGRSPRDGEFSFEIRREGAAASSAPLAAGTNNGDGIITFSPAVALTEKDLGAADEASVKLLISEVPGDDPSIMYLKEPVEYVVTLLRKTDGTLIAKLPGQTAEHEEATCPACGGQGSVDGLFGTIIDSDSMSYDGDPIPLSGVFNDTWLDICPDCGGTGRDPVNPASPCSSCSGAGFSFKPCTHLNQTEEGFCPDCLGLNIAAIPMSDGRFLVPIGFSMETSGLVSALNGASLDPSRFSGASYKTHVAFILTAAQWAQAQASMSIYSVYDDAKYLYICHIDSNGPCNTCGGTGKVQGDWIVSGDPVPPVVTNHLKGRVDFQAAKTMEGKPAEDPFTFVLLELDSEGREVQIAKAKNSTDGKVDFGSFWVDPDGKAHTFIIRETAGTDSSIAYDDSETWYQVTVTEDESGMPVVEKLRTEGDGVFRNTYRDGTISVTIHMKGTDPEAEPPAFPVTVVLTGRDGKPLANRTFSAPPTRGRLRSAGTPVLETDENGRGTVMVAGGSTLVIPAIPHGTAFELSQAADTMPKYFSQSGAEGTKGTVTGGAESKASFENTYSAPKPSASVSPSPTPTPTPTPTPASSPKSSPSASPSPTPTPTPAATAKAVSAPTPTFTPTPSPAPSATPVTTPATTDLPGPTSTPNPYVYHFSFTKKWEGGSEDSIDFVVYNPDGTVRSKKFNKKIISDTEWLYEAWFTSPADLYVIETVPRGYRVRYENTGINAGVTDRCCNGGTIVNYTVPKTGDRTNLLIFLGLSLLGIGCFIASFILGPCAESRSVRKWKKTARQANGNRMDPDGI